MICKKEKIRKIYEKMRIIINDETIDEILKNKERTESFMRLYKQEEMDSIN